MCGESAEPTVPGGSGVGAGHEVAVDLEGGGGVPVAEAVEPLLEQRDHRLGRRGAEAAVAFGDDGGELPLRLPLATAEYWLRYRFCPVTGSAPSNTRSCK